MKKLIIFAIALMMFACVPVSAEDSELDKAREFLSDKSSDPDTFLVEEYPVRGGGKQLFVRIAAVPEDTVEGSEHDLLYGADDMFAEMANQEWFDYISIMCISFSRTTGYMNYVSYYAVNGTKVKPYGVRTAWLINTEDDIEEEKLRFLGRVAQELVDYNINGSIYLDIGNGGEDNLTVEECNGYATVRGECEHDGRTYDFITEFSYTMESETTGKYDTIYVGANGLDLYGEYEPLEEIVME